MRRMLLTAAVAATVFAPSAQAVGGRVNPQIAGLQVALRAWGLYPGAIDGISGPQTSNALHAFQRIKGIHTGVANVRTRIALGPLGRPLFGSRALRLRDFGWDVSVLQFVLTRDGFYRGALDGYFDKTTAAALRKYQQSVHLTADAVVGPRTLSSIVHRASVPVRPRPAVVVRVVYVVRAGDSLTAISHRFHTTVAALAQENHLDPARPLLIGTHLRVPHTLPPISLAASTVDVRSLLDTWSNRLGVDPHLVRALAWMESGYHTRIVSAAGARGVLQTLPLTRTYVETVILGRKAPRTVSGDIEVGVVLLKHLLNVFNGNQRLALGAWYQGERAVRKHGLYKVSKPFVADVLALRARM